MKNHVVGSVGIRYNENGGFGGFAAGLYILSEVFSMIMALLLIY